MVCELISALTHASASSLHSNIADTLRLRDQYQLLNFMWQQFLENEMLHVNYLCLGDTFSIIMQSLGRVVTLDYPDRGNVFTVLVLNKLVLNFGTVISLCFIHFEDSLLL